MLRVLNAVDLRDPELTKAWAKRGCRIANVPLQQLVYELNGPLGAELTCDCITCVPNVRKVRHSRGESTDNRAGLEAALRVASELRDLPASVAMPDGRKWSAIPFIVLIGRRLWPGEQLYSEGENLTVIPYEKSSEEALDLAKLAVASYRQRLLDELDNLGLVVRHHEGRYEVGHALTHRSGLDGRFYYSPADRRREKPGKLFTVATDIFGAQHEVELFERLINDPNTAESQLQRFFEDHPHFLPMQSLMEALPQVRLRDTDGKLLIPDFVLKPIVAALRDSNWEVLDIKKPGARLLTSISSHPKLSEEAHKALAQLSDYGDYFADPTNAEEVERVLGQRLRYPTLAVLIGRLPPEELIPELEKQQHRERTVRLVTYDEVLERQQELLAEH